MGRPKKASKKPVLKVKKKPVQKVTGMRDILPNEMNYFDYFQKVADQIAGVFGFKKIETPILEHTDLFARSTGRTSDIVSKEMFSFVDKGGDDLSLRPEGTPGVVRAYIENGMHTVTQPVKLYYFGPMFRREKPQAGRYRQFHQFNLEALGSGKPILDAEVIFIAWKILNKLGLEKMFEIQVNSVGCRLCREQYRSMLVDFLSEKKQRLCIDCKKRLKKNPLRILDCKVERCRELANEAPQIIDYLCEECHDHFKSVLEYLDESKISYNLNSKLVRGLDYYTKTAFEIWPLGVDGTVIQNSLGGGGRYDDLVEIMGGRETPAVGFAFGIERIIDYLKSNGKKIANVRRPDIILVQLGDMAKKKSLEIINKLIDNNIKVIESLHKDSIRAQLRFANDMGVKFSLVLGQKEVLDKTILIRDMESGIQEVLNLDTLVSDLKKRLKSKR